MPEEFPNHDDLCECCGPHAPSSVIWDNVITIDAKGRELSNQFRQASGCAHAPSGLEIVQMKDGAGYLGEIFASMIELCGKLPQNLRRAHQHATDLHAQLNQLVNDEQASLIYVNHAKQLREVGKLLRQASNAALSIIPRDACQGELTSERQQAFALGDSIAKHIPEIIKVGTAGANLRKIDSLHLSIVYWKDEASKLPNNIAAPALNALERAQKSLPGFMGYDGCHISGDSFSGSTWDLSISPFQSSLHFSDNVIGGGVSYNVYWPHPHGLQGLAQSGEDTLPVVKSELFEFVLETCFPNPDKKPGRAEREALEKVLLPESDPRLGREMQLLPIPFKFAALDLSAARLPASQTLQG